MSQRRKGVSSTSKIETMAKENGESSSKTAAPGGLKDKGFSLLALGAGVSVVWGTSISPPSLQLFVGLGGVTTSLVTSYLILSKKANRLDPSAPSSKEEERKEDRVHIEQEAIHRQIQCGMMSVVSMMGVAAVLCRSSSGSFSSIPLFSLLDSDRALLAFRSLSLSVFPLLWAVVNVGSRRYPDEKRSQEVTDGKGGDETMRIPMSFLQNTTEQFIIHSAAQMGLAASLPEGWGCLVPLNSLLFVGGRILFYLGYTHAPVMRAYGFTFAIFPSAISLIYSNLKSFFGVDLVSLISSFFSS